MISVVDSQKQPVALDRYIVTDLGTYTQERVPNEVSRRNGRHTLITDQDKEIIRAGGSRLRFRGIVQGEVVVEEDLGVGYNCCHVYLISDQDTLYAQY